jgi:cell division protein FtsX
MFMELLFWLWDSLRNSFKTKRSRKNLLISLGWGLYLALLVMMVSQGSLYASICAFLAAASFSWIVLVIIPILVKWVKEGIDE